MKKKMLILSVICSFGILEQGYATDDVYVDLSVLDNIPQDSISSVQSEPLFPVVKKISKPVVKKQAKKQKQVKAKITSTSEEKVIKPAKKMKNEIITEKEHDNPFKELKVEPTEETLTQSDVVEEKSQVSSDQQAEITNETFQDASIAKEEKTIDIAQEKEFEAEKEPTIIFPPQLKSDLTQQEEQEQNPQEDIKINNDMSLNSEASVEQRLEEKPLQDNSVSEDVTMSATDKPEILPLVAQPKEIYTVSFAEDSSELSQEAMQKLSEIGRNFDANHRKKISIKAYNYDNGVDSFRHKRISLNRATEVRSFFLGNGFKNFSIKIINTTADNEYKNVVEIEEID